MIYSVRANTSSRNEHELWEGVVFLFIDAESKGQARRIGTQLFSEMLNWPFEITQVQEDNRP
jgi:hypothetical protein